MKALRFFRFHPVTGQDANELPIELLNVDQRQELAQMVSNGAKFYWEPAKDNGPDVLEGYSRVEHGDMRFVLDATGQPYEFVEAPT